MTGYEPRWDVPPLPSWQRDREYGEWAEERWKALQEESVEVKRKRRRDSELYVETGQRPGWRGLWVPSGVMTTRADWYTFAFDTTDLWLLVRTERIRRAVMRSAGRSVEEHDGDCPTRGRLIHLETLLSPSLDIPEEPDPGRPF